MAEANQNNCNIDDNLWQWGNSLITQYNQRIDDRIAAEQRIAQAEAQAQAQASAQSQPSWMDVMETVVKGVQDVQSGQDRRSGQGGSSGGRALPSSIPQPTMDIPPMPGMGGVVYEGTGPFSGSDRSTQAQGGAQSQGNTQSGSSTGSGSSSPPPSGGMSAQACELHFCPVCAKGAAGVDLMGVAVSPQCNDCRRQYSSKINDCMKGGRTDRPATSTSQFNTYSVLKCKKPLKDSKGKTISYHYFYEVTGPGRDRGPPDGISCQAISKGSWKECIDEATNLNRNGNTHYNIVP